VAEKKELVENLINSLREIKSMKHYCGISDCPIDVDRKDCPFEGKENLTKTIEALEEIINV